MSISPKIGLHGAIWLTIVSLSVRPSDAIYRTRFVDTTSTLVLVQLTSDFVHMKAKILNLGLIKVTCRSEQKCSGITGVTVHYVPLVNMYKLLLAIALPETRYFLVKILLQALSNKAMTFTFLAIGVCTGAENSLSTKMYP